MSTWGESLGKGARPELGVGVTMKPQDQPTESDVLYSQWRIGLVVLDIPEDIPTGAAASLTDTEVDETDALIRAPGVTLDQNVNPRSAKYMFQQAAIDFSTELVVIDPPFVGYKSTAAFTFNNNAIAATGLLGWTAADVGGTLIFSNGSTATYTRVSGAAVVTDITVDIIAQCFATAFGRVFAGAFVDPINGLQSLAIAWNAASGNIADWAGLGSGAEFLISNNQQADRIMAIVPIGLQAIGILCRKSLWAGYETQNSDRPADFQLRFPGLGCVRRETAVATSLGVMYLADAGVCLFDLNQSVIISESINALLTPLNYAQIASYSAAFDETNQRYMLNTPTGIFVYEFPRPNAPIAVPGRWFFRSFLSDSITVFTNQSGSVFWNTVVGPWNLQTLTWAEMVIGEENAPSIVYFGLGTKVGYEDYSATDNMGVAQNPFWNTPQDAKHVTEVFETHWIEVQYRSPTNIDITFTGADTMGDFTQSVTKTLPGTGNLRSKVIFGVHTMVGIGEDLQISFSATAIGAIERIRRVTMPAGTTTDVTI